MGINRRFFDGLLADRGMSLRQLGRRMGMTHSQLSLTFSGARRMQLDEACQLADIFGITLNQVAMNAGVAGASRAGRQVNVIGALRGNGEVELSDSGTMQRTLCPEGMPPDVEAIQARTTDTPLAWMDGWLMFFDPTDRSQSQADGRLSYIRLADGRHVIATCRRGYAEGSSRLSGPFNSEDEQVVWATPILITQH